MEAVGRGASGGKVKGAGMKCGRRMHLVWAALCDRIHDCTIVLQNLCVKYREGISTFY